MYEALLLFLLIFAPLVHGAVEVWSVTVLHVVSIIMVMWWGLSMVHNGRLRLVRTPLDVFALIFLLLTCLSLFVSVYPYASRIQLYRVVNYLFVFYVVINTITSTRRLTVFIWILALFGGLFAIAGLTLTDGEFMGLKIFSNEKSYISFTFVNHNHFAGYLEMITMLCMGLAMANQGAKRMFLLAVAVVSSTAIVMSLSRGGMIGLTGGLLFFAVSLAFYKGGRKNIFIILGLTVFVLSGLFFSGKIETVVERVYTLGTPSEAGFARLEVWKDTLNMVKAKPWFGSGLGTFEYIYPRYQSMGAGEYAVKHAHNDYLELIVEMGIIGFLSAFFGVTLLGVFSLRKLLTHRERKFQSIGLGALSACFSLLLHGLTDFNFRIPSNALLFTVCAGVAFVCASIVEMPSLINFGLSKKGKLLLYCVILVLSIVSTILTISPYIGNIYLKKAIKYEEAKDYNSASDALKNAVLFDLGNAEMYAVIGDMFVERSGEGESINNRKESVFKEALKYYNKAIEACPVRSYYYAKKAFALLYLERFREAEDALRKAVHFDPMNYLNHYSLARFYLDRGKLDKAFNEYRISIQLRNYEHMIKVLDEVWLVTQDYDDLRQVVPDDVFMRRGFADYLIKKGRNDDALQEFAFIFSLQPTVENAANHIFWARRMKKYKMAKETGEKYLMRFGHEVVLLRQMAPVYKVVGEYEKAIYTYRQLIEKDFKLRSHYILQLANLYRDKKQCYKAITILQAALQYQPDNAELYHLMGKCYRDINRSEEALKAQKKAVSLAPNNAEFRYLLALEYLYNNFHKEAYEQLEKCIEIDPKNKWCRSQIKRLERRQ